MDFQKLEFYSHQFSSNPGRTLISICKVLALDMSSHLY